MMWSVQEGQRANGRCFTWNGVAFRIFWLSPSLGAIGHVSDGIQKRTHRDGESQFAREVRMLLRPLLPTAWARIPNGWSHSRSPAVCPR